MKADKKYIAFVYNKVTGTHKWKTFDSAAKAERWCDKTKERMKMKHFSPNILDSAVYTSLVGIMARLRDGFVYRERGLALAMHACACYFTGKQYPLPTVDNPFVVALC